MVSHCHDQLVRGRRHHEIGGGCFFVSSALRARMRTRAPSQYVLAGYDRAPHALADQRHRRRATRPAPRDLVDFRSVDAALARPAALAARCRGLAHVVPPAWSRCACRVRLGRADSHVPSCYAAGALPGPNGRGRREPASGPEAVRLGGPPPCVQSAQQPERCVCVCGTWRWLAHRLLGTGVRHRACGA